MEVLCVYETLVPDYAKQELDLIKKKFLRRGDRPRNFHKLLDRNEFLLASWRRSGTFQQNRVCLYRPRNGRNTAWLRFYPRCDRRHSHDPGPQGKNPGTICPIKKQLEMPRFPIRKESSSEDDGMLRGTISESDYTHITKVLRLGAGDRITVFDTESTEYEGIIRDISSKTIALRVHDTRRL